MIIIGVKNISRNNLIYYWRKKVYAHEGLFCEFYCVCVNIKLDIIDPKNEKNKRIDEI